jgi:hypothetical protein
MTQYISITEDATKQVVKTIDLAGSTYKRACKVMDGLEINLDNYNFTATLYGYEQELEHQEYESSCFLDECERNHP